MIFKHKKVKKGILSFLLFVSTVTFLTTFYITKDSNSGISIILYLAAGVFYGYSIQYWCVMFFSKYIFNDESIVVKVPFNDSVQLDYDKIRIKEYKENGEGLIIEYQSPLEDVEMTLVPEEYEKFKEELEKRIK